MTQGGERYSRGAIAFHWAIAALVIFNLTLGIFHEVLPRDWKVMPVHKSVGILVLALTLGRIAWRLMHRPPPLPPALPAWEKAVAKAVHWIFYGLLLFMPLSGWIWSSDPTRIRVVSFFGLFDLPVLPSSKALAGVLHESHEILGYGMAGLVVLHIAGALRHHFLLKDGMLGRMISARSANN